VTQWLLVTPQANRFADFSAGVESEGGTVHRASSGAQALEKIQTGKIDLVVVDEDLGDMPGLAFVEKLVAVNPMLNAALVSSLEKGDYHEVSEGLGILMQLPPAPDASDAKRLMEHLKTIMGFTLKTT
jgi:CheY-like chemotaxis protein